MITRRTFLVGAAATSLCAYAFDKVQKVKVGVCSRDVAGAQKYGFDYIEPAAAEIAAMSDEQFKQYTDTIFASPLRCHAFNSFIRRPDLKVVGDQVPTAALKEYVEMALSRCKQLGGEVVVWGSAGSRNVPEAFSRERANDQIAEFLRMAGDVARKNRITVAIEPLRHQESNILNTGAEALAMVRKVKHPNVRMIIDYYHLREENEDPKIVETGKEEIVHIHFANPHGRTWPHDLSEDDHYASFFSYLKKTGYSGAISIEGQGTFDKDATASLDFFHKALN